MVGRRLNLWRLRNFHLTRLEAPEDVLLYECVARDNPSDVRLVALAQVRQLAVVRDEEGRVIGLPHAERAVENCLESIRRARTSRATAKNRLDTNHVWVQVWPVVEADPSQLATLQNKITPLTDGAGIEEVLAQGRIANGDGTPTPLVIRFHARPGAGVTASLEDPPTEPLKPLDEYSGNVLRARRRGLVYPYELEGVLAGPGGTLVEHDLDDTGVLVPVERPRGLNKAGILVAVVSTPTARHPEGVTRVVLCGDPTRALGAVSEPECSRIIAALDLAERMQVPLEWFALSAGARISMDSGTENMDWVAAGLKRIIEFTQAGGEINIVVAGINVGAQPYWNAEATMLMHTKGILVMTPDSAMVLTGKQSLDFSGGVSAEDNYGIGGYDRVMGPNGQAQYWAPDLAGACSVLMAHYDHTYVVPGESRPRRATTTDPADRDVSSYPHEIPDSDFRTVGEIFSAATNPDRKKAFDIRTVMRALADQDHPTLERWAGMADAETAVVQDAHLGGYPVCLLGIESRQVPRHGFPPTDGPDVYTAGTLFPRSSKKAARAINAASGNRPLVVLANLSGFDGSPESMRSLQLEYGAEIGRAIVNFEGPIIFTVISRYHGGAFVVFSKALNPNMTVLALEGSFASVIGGAPAAAVVFAGEVEKRTSADPAGQGARRRDRRGHRHRPGPARRGARRAARRRPPREDRRGRRRVRRRPRHPPGGAGRLGRRGDHRRAPAAPHHRGDRGGSALARSPLAAGRGGGGGGLGGADQGAGVAGDHGPHDQEQGEVGGDDHGVLPRRRVVHGHVVTRDLREHEHLVGDHEVRRDVEGGDHRPVQDRGPGSGRLQLGRAVEPLQRPARTHVEVAVGHQPPQQEVVEVPPDRDRGDHDVQAVLEEVAGHHPGADEPPEGLRVAVEERGDRQRRREQRDPAAPVPERALVRDGPRTEHEQVERDDHDVQGEEADRQRVGEQRVEQPLRMPPRLEDLPDPDPQPPAQQRDVDRADRPVHAVIPAAESRRNRARVSVTGWLTAVTTLKRVLFGSNATPSCRRGVLRSM